MVSDPTTTFQALTWLLHHFCLSYLAKNTNLNQASGERLFFIKSAYLLLLSEEAVLGVHLRQLLSIFIDFFVFFLRKKKKDLTISLFGGIVYLVKIGLQ